jgi:hypothetical protein
VAVEMMVVVMEELVMDRERKMLLVPVLVWKMSSKLQYGVKINPEQEDDLMDNKSTDAMA